MHGAGLPQEGWDSARPVATSPELPQKPPRKALRTGAPPRRTLERGPQEAILHGGRFVPQGNAQRTCSGPGGVLGAGAGGQGQARINSQQQLAKQQQCVLGTFRPRPLALLRPRHKDTG